MLFSNKCFRKLQTDQPNLIERISSLFIMLMLYWLRLVPKGNQMIKQLQVAKLSVQHDNFVTFISLIPDYGLTLRFGNRHQRFFIDIYGRTGN